MTLRELINMQVLYENFKIRIFDRNGNEGEEYDKTKILNRLVTMEDLLSAKNWNGGKTLPEECLDYQVMAIYGSNHKYKLAIEIKEV